MSCIVLASRNPVKERSVREAFARMFPSERFDVMTLAVESDVGDQPMSDRQTLAGALTRAERAKQQLAEGDYWIGIECGVEDGADGMAAFAWAVVLDRTRIGKGRTGTFFLPDRVAACIRAGLELGDADDVVFGTENSKQDMGAVGILTSGVIDRAALYEHAVILALASFKNPKFYDMSYESLGTDG